MRAVEPVVGLRSRTLVSQTEDHERLVDAVLGTDSLYAVLAAFQFIVD